MDYRALSGPILIAEDDKKTAALVVLYLEREGFQTLVAHDGQQALALATRYKPGFVILDLMLPSVDGWEVCRELDARLTCRSSSSLHVKKSSIASSDSRSVPTITS